MRTLYLLRHAKSSWKDTSLEDLERPLNQRGRDAAALMGEYLVKKKIKLSLIVSSPAVRTRETLDILLASSGLRVEARFDERIYEADVRRLVNVIGSVEDENTELLLLGHNPGMEELLTFLTGDRRDMPTAALAKITLETSGWSRLQHGAGRLEWFTTPKELLKS